jgi:outer membrane protein assembly factor BamB
MICRTLLCCVLLLLAGAVAKGQRTLDYDNVVVRQNRIDARDLGYPPIDVIPDGESAITALTIAPNGNLYGATSGKRSHLFVLNPRHGYVQPLGFLPGTTAVTNALVVSAAGDVYIGSAPGGHLLKYTPRREDEQPLRVKEPCEVTDLGPAVEGESPLTLAIDRRAGVIYGLTFPNAHFFKFTIASGTSADLGVVARRSPEGEKFEATKTVSRMLALDLKGNVYASGEDGFLFKFDKEKEALEKLPVRVPAIPGREPWTRVDAFWADPSGLIFGGTSDGYLFRFDPEKLAIDNLGKPLLQYRVTGLVRGANGKLYGVGGDQDDLARLFSYDPENGTYQILGFVDVNRRPYYTWQAYVIQAMAVGLDGTIYIGESERVSKLYLFYPW